MEEAIEIDMDITIAEALRQRKKSKRKSRAKAGATDKLPDSTTENLPAAEEIEAGDTDKLPDSTTENFPAAEEIEVSLFDYSVENHFKAMDKISELCGEAELELDETEIQRLSSSITFLREWKHFNYQPRTIRFSCQSVSPQGKDVIGEINLPQLSSAFVPKKHKQIEDCASSDSGTDFVMYVGGSVWALDWCPIVHQNYESHAKSEFIAVAAHPPESSYHKIGAPLTGRGLIQIWCVLNDKFKEEYVTSQVKKKSKQQKNNSQPKVKSTQPQKPRGRPRKTPVFESKDKSPQPKKPKGRPRKRPVLESPQPKKPKGRPRKRPVLESNDKSPQLQKRTGRPRKRPIIESEDDAYIIEEDIDSDYHFDVETAALKVNPVSGENLSGLLPVNDAAGTICEHAAEEESIREKIDSGKGRNENPVLTASAPRLLRNKAKRRANYYENDLPSLSKEGNNEAANNLDVPSSCGNDIVGQPNENVTSNSSLGMNSSKCSSCKDVVLPRAVLCLAHNGKVAWDVKWKPSDSCDVKSKHRIGYLAVLLGNGALEVWDVPSPRAVKFMYSASRKEGTDPRFVKLGPVFRCSKIKSGDRQSVPLTVEWSASPPHDLILAGCHDGVVALWKFSDCGSSKDTRPLLCFSADTVPIRALAWAPSQSDPESANVIVTAGHKGLKFWDIRDPFHPLWDLNPVQRVVCSLDWIPNPRCIIISYDDGAIRTLSLSKAANDVPITGKPFAGTPQQGLHSYYCSSYTIWSIQVSRVTGMVAYCSADGTVLRFQLTTKAVEGDHLRNRAPHFLCGSMTEEDATLTMYTPLPDIPFPMKKSLNEFANFPRSMRGFLSKSNQQRRAKEEMARGQTSNHQLLALCYGDDPGTESGSEELIATKSKKASKTKSNSDKMPKASQALVCRDEDPEPVQLIEGNVEEEKIEVLPPKIIGMHKVRWNMNKGSERWLCYGGASGIVRCQELNL